MEKALYIQRPKENHNHLLAHILESCILPKH